jgi:hypothetical protein
VVGDLLGSFSEVESAIRNEIFPALFKDKQEADDSFSTLLGLPIKQAGVALANPTELGQANYEASILVCSHLLAAFRGRVEFSTTDHLSVHKEVFAKLKHHKATEYLATLASLLLLMPSDTRRTILCRKETGMWLTLAPSTVNGTKLSTQEFRDHLFLRYGKRPPDLPSHCDGCLVKFDICHALQCKKGGLVIMRHNKIKDKLCDLLSKALVPSAVHDKLIIYPCFPVVLPTPAPREPDPVRRINSLLDNDNEDILVCGFSARGMDCIIDVRVTHMDAKSQCQKDPDKGLDLLNTNGKRSASTLSHVSNNGGTSLHLWFLLTDFWDERQLSSFGNFWRSSMRNGISHIQWCAALSNLV